MNAARYVVAVTLLAFLPTVYAAEKDKEEIALKDVPSAVLATMEKESKKAPLEEVERIRGKDKTVYETEFSAKDRRYQLLVAEDGKLISRKALKGFGKRIKRISAEDMPATVRSALESAVGSGKLRDTDLVRYNGQPHYEAEYTQDGKEMQVLLDESGAIVAQREVK